MVFLYTGLKVASEWKDREEIVHCPLISIEPFAHEQLGSSLEGLSKASHLLFTSQIAVELFFKWRGIIAVPVFSVGKATTQCLLEKGWKQVKTAKESTSEGVVEMLKGEKIEHLFWGHSALSRPVISSYLKKEDIAHTDCILYTTATRVPEKIPLFDEVIFTSPSTIDAFVQIFGALPSEGKCHFIGPVTKNHYSHLSSPLCVD